MVPFARSWERRGCAARPEEHFSFNVKWASAAHGGAARVAIGVVARHALSRGP